MTALVSEASAGRFEERFLPIEDGRMAAKSREIQCIHCCVQSPGGTRRMP